MLYTLGAWRGDASDSLATAHAAEVVLGTSQAGSPGAVNPVEFLLAALAACMIKGVERVTPMLAFQFETVEVRLDAERQDVPPKLTAIRHESVVGTVETDARLAPLLRNILKYGTISNSLARAVPIEGTIRRA